MNIYKTLISGKNHLQEFVDLAVRTSLSIPITCVENVEKLMTSQTQCKGSDKQVVKWNTTPCPTTGECPSCGQIVAMRYARIPERVTNSGMKMAAGGMWITLPHEKPFASRCANCGTGLYESDYLCRRCRRASLGG